MKRPFIVNCEICGEPGASYTNDWTRSYTHRDQRVCLENLEYKRRDLKMKEKLKEQQLLQENGAGI